jgi:Peptidase_C39 like family
MLISTYRMYRESGPHWTVVYDHDQRYIFARDPFVDPDEHEVPLGKTGLAIPMDEFDSIAAYGRSRPGAAVVVEAIPAS